jgi:ATP-dependent exoDNAse (exonuclease V) beta subunit
VDEFQDTSLQQFELLSKLVHGWQPTDGKTLFVVGDPMQSIYRFRSAEVGLFLRAQQQGIGPITLIPLELSCNFRSTETIVNWVNQHFQTIFPESDDIESGAVTFHPSLHVKPTEDHTHVMGFQYASREQEAKALVQRVASELQDHPKDKIAILVRSRKQLSHIIRSLREHHIPFQGVDIDLLAQLPHLRDVWTLTQALLMPANRLTWLALLRSPWCGLSLSDLLHIATFDKNKSIFFALSQLEHITFLSEEGRVRATFIYQVLNRALSFRHQQPLITWINQTLKNLYIDHILDLSQKDDVEQYWLLLERFEQNGQLTDLSLFSHEFNKLYSQRVVPSRLQIMTIHKSKGLEFDTVFLPGLSTKPPNPHTPMLRWLQLPSEEHGDILLLSPIKASHHEQCPLYDYLGKLDAQKNSYEAQRLLYVAATRAKKRLYLFDHSEKIGHGSFRQLLQHQEFNQQAPEEENSKTIENLPALYRLPIDFYQRPPSLNDSELKLNTTPINISSSTPRLIGIVAHELLQWVCDHHPTSASEIPWELGRYQLKSLGLHDLELDTAQSLLQKQLTQFVNDPIGQWIIKAHDDEQNEYELLVNHHNEIATRIIDRTFYDKGARWIIDFKTGADDSTTEEQHRAQVDGYANLFATHGDRMIQCGLYYLASNRWLAWEYNK